MRRTARVIAIAAGFSFSALGCREASAPSGRLAASAAPLSQVVGSSSITRGNNTATLLVNGKVLVAGGTDNSSNYLSTSELYDPAIGTWSLTTGKLNVARKNHAAV